MQLGDMYPAVLTFVLVAILLGVGLTVLGTLGNSTSLTSTASAAVNSTVTSVDDFVTWIPILVVIIAASIIISMVVRSFRG